MITLDKTAIFFEIEVKFYITNRKTIIKQINKLGANNIGKCFETNIRYENKEHDLMGEKLLIRLRSANKITLTVKKPARIQSTEFKINQEVEVTVDSLHKMNDILNILGYHSEQTYEKWRETWQLGKTTLCLDTMPYGCFLEVEGQPRRIKTIVSSLGLNWDDRIIASYLEIFETMKEKESLDFNNLKFSRFRKNPDNFARYRQIFENGQPTSEKIL